MRLAKRILQFLGLQSRPNRRERMANYLDMLRKSGMKIGDDVAIYNCTLDTNYPFLIEIGAHTIVTHATILAHDASPLAFGKGVITGPVKIGSRCFIGAGAIIMPGVIVGDESIIGAQSVVTADVPPRSVIAGNPARRLCSIEEWENGLSNLKGRKQIIISERDYVVPTEEQTKALALAAKKVWLENEDR